MQASLSGRMRLLAQALLWVVAALGLAADALGLEDPAVESVARGFFPQADVIGPFAGKPPAAAVYRDRLLLGYVLLTDQVFPIPAYSGKPISTLVGFDLRGQLVGVRIMSHEEPILVVGVTEEHLARYIAQYEGKYVTDRVKIGGGDRKGYVTVDGISGATITVMVLNRSIMAAAQKVAASRGLLRDKTRKEVEQAATADPVLDPMWEYAWHQRTVEIAVLAGGLIFLTLVLVFQDWLARYPSLLLYVRDGFLVYTVLFIGWYGLAQLSVVNVLTFVHAIMHGFVWDTFLIDPLMFILWGFVAVTVILWGRGVYCGWLCPFGALQELLYQLARKLRLPAWEFPQMVHERLWAIKYIVLIFLFGVSLGSLEAAVRYAEVEPFKTAFVLRFQREWWFVLYAGGLLFIAVFVRKFFCRYLCPLGAGLTFPGRFHIFSWLRRHRECGRPCQICAELCEVRAINKAGEIDENECHYCLDCQVIYWDDHKCPPVVDRRKRRERRAKRAGKAATGLAVPLTNPRTGRADRQDPGGPT